MESTRTRNGDPILQDSFVGEIPVRNIWLLMLYASDLFREIGKGKKETEQNPDDVPDLIAEILAHEVELRLKRNLTVGYQSRRDDLHRVRGQIDFLSTDRRQLLSFGKIACRFQELTTDTVRNRFVRSALEKLSAIASRRSLAHRCRALAGSLLNCGVVGVTPTRAEVSSDRVGRHDAHDARMVAAAKLAHDLAFPTEIAGSKILPIPDRHLPWLRKLFEKAVAGFYSVVLPDDWRVTAGESYRWQTCHESPGSAAILPTMRTDVVVEHSASGWRLIVDTKFNSLLTRGWYREEVIRSGYLYQIYAYVRSQERVNDPLSNCAAGMLLHPAVGGITNEKVVIQGHELRFFTVDLQSTAKEIRRQLLCAIQPAYSPVAS